MNGAQPGPTTEASPCEPSVEVGPAFPACMRDCHFRSEADHRVANHLTLLSGYARMKGAEFDGEGVADHAAVRLIFQGIDAQIRAVARLHRLLTRQSGIYAVDLSLLLHEICGPFTGSPEQRVALVEDLEAGCAVSSDHVLSIGQIVGEAIINAMKYAFPDSATGVLLIRSRRSGQGAVCIDVIDSGPGLPATFDPDCDGGFGFNLMRSISRGLRARLRFDSSPEGLRVSLTLPDAGTDVRQPPSASRGDGEGIGEF